jgi:3-hydroxyacyl-CoA dehydrogenase
VAERDTAPAAGDRMLRRLAHEADRLVVDGALPHEVDRVLVEFGFPMGPFARADLAGLDADWRLRQARGETAAIADRLCAMGRFGRTTGAGYYRYDAEGRATPDPEIDKLFVDVAARLGLTRRPIAGAEIRKRLLYPLVNEGARILEEQVAVRASDIDVLWGRDHGWPIYRGGPLFWADFDQGLAAVRDRLLEYGRTLGDRRWTPAALLSDLAERGETFTGYHPTMTYAGLYGPPKGGAA